MEKINYLHYMWGCYKVDEIYFLDQKKYMINNG